MKIKSVNFNNRRRPITLNENSVWEARGTSLAGRALPLKSQPPPAPPWNSPWNRVQCVCRYLKNHTDEINHIFYTCWSSSEIAIRYVLPVLWMTSRIHSVDLDGLMQPAVMT